MKYEPEITPDLPPPTEHERAANRQITAMLEVLADELKQRNLDRAVRLAQQAARGDGPLIEHFAELGRRFGGALTRSPLVSTGEADHD